MSNERDFRHVGQTPEDETNADFATAQQNGQKLPPLYSRTPEYEAKQRSRRRLRAAVRLVLLIAFVGAGWYYWPWMKEQSGKLAQIPEIQEALAVINQRTTDVEEELRLRRADWASLRERLAGYDRKIDDGLATAKNHATSAADQLEQRLNSRLTGSTEQLSREMERLRSAQNGDSARLTALRGEVNQLREEIESTRLVAGRNRDESRDDIRNIQYRLDRNDDQLTAVSHRLHRDRIDFEISKNVSREVAPGILLQLTGADVRHSRYKGWLRLTPEGRTLWLRDQGVNQPVVFYRKGSDQPGQLVITSVREEYAAGYVLLPRPDQPDGTSSSASGG